MSPKITRQLQTNTPVQRFIYAAYRLCSSSTTQYIKAYRSINVHIKSYIKMGEGVMIMISLQSLVLPARERGAN